MAKMCSIELPPCRAPMFASMAALAASKLNARVKLKLSLSDNMRICGKRPEYSFAYSVFHSSQSNLLQCFSDIVPLSGLAYVLQ